MLIFSSSCCTQQIVSVILNLKMSTNVKKLKSNICLLLTCRSERLRRRVSGLKVLLRRSYRVKTISLLCFVLESSQEPQRPQI